MPSISGVVLNGNGLPVAEATVLIVSGPEHPDIAAVTNDRGQFRFSSLRSGDYTIQANGPSDEQAQTSVAASTPGDHFAEIRF